MVDFSASLMDGQGPSKVHRSWTIKLDQVHTWACIKIKFKQLLLPSVKKNMKELRTVNEYKHTSWSLHNKLGCELTRC